MSLHQEDRTMSLWLRILRAWLPGALVLTVACGIGYAAVQQVYRQNADDPQLQMAHDAAANIVKGDSSNVVVPSTKIDIATSLAPFTIVYDISNVPRAWSGLLNGTAPVPPDGVLAAARDHGENRVTWEPSPGVRIATIIVPADAARERVVLVGRSLSEVEARISQLGAMVGAGLAIGLAALLALVALLEWLPSLQKPKGSEAV